MDFLSIANNLDDRIVIRFLLNIMILLQQKSIKLYQLSTKIFLIIKIIININIFLIAYKYFKQ